MTIPIRINDDISISKESILSKYKSINSFFKKCLEALYGKNNSISINCFLPCNMIKEGTNNDLKVLMPLKDRTGIYIFLDSNSIPVYIGIGGQKINANQGLKARIGQELRAFKNEGDTGTTLSKNIQEIDSLLENKKITADESILRIKSFSLLSIDVGDIAIEVDVFKSKSLETILIALYHPKYNK